MPLDDRITAVTDRIIDRSRDARSTYLDRMRRLAEEGPRRAHLSCGNQAHAYAAMEGDKDTLAAARSPNLGIVTAYNDMLSAHQPFHDYPDRIKEAARRVGATAQVAGGVPAMCDGVTQGQTGMELSLFSRDVIALATGVALSHNTFDAVLYLGVCDKIVPGLVMAAGTFGYLPGLFVPAGPMVSGLPNDEKAKVRQQFAAGEVGREALMEAEMASYHGPGTCTFYGTANSNQMLMEFMGLHLPGASFVNPGTSLRDALTDAATARAAAITALGNDYRPAGRVLDEPCHPPARHGAGSGRDPRYRGFQRPLLGRSPDGEDLSQRPRRREPFPRRGRLGLHDRRVAGGRPSPPGHRDHRRRRPRALRPRAEAEGRRARLGGRRGRKPQRPHPAPRLRPVPEDRRAEGTEGQPRPVGDEGLRRRSRAPGRRGPGAGVSRTAGCEGRLQGWRVHRRHRGRRPLPGSARQRHARAARADADALGAPVARPEGRPRHRRAHVGGVGKGACRDARRPRGRRRRSPREASRRRPGAGRRHHRHP